jgi:hypothetical protein
MRRNDTPPSAYGSVMTKFTHSIVLSSFLFVFAGCIDDAAEDDSETVSETEQGIYSNWVTVGDCMVARFCRTASRINWQFAYNSCSTVTTFGNTFGEITSNIAGVPSGSKYRTRNGATAFYMRFNGGPVGGYHYGRSVESMPDCAWIYNPGQ